MEHGGRRARPRLAFIVLIAIVAVVITSWLFGLATGLVLLPWITLVVAAFRWERGIYLVLGYVTVEGAITNLLFPDVYPASLLVTDSFLGATYIGFAIHVWRRRELGELPRAIVLPLVALVSIAVAESFNPLGAGPLVALVGMRVLFFYVPLYAIGAYMARRLELGAVLGFVLLSAVPVMLFGIVEYFLGSNTVRSFGPGFARNVWTIATFSGDTEVGIYRPESTFIFVANFGLFLIFITTVAFAALHMPGRRTRLLYGAVFAISLLATVAQAGRTNWVILPISIVCVYALNLRSRAQLRAVMPLVGAAVIAAALLLTATSIGTRFPEILDPHQYAKRLEPYLGLANQIGPVDMLVGHGTGTALAAVRHVNEGQIPSRVWELGWFEPLWMFGIWGVAAYIWLYAVMLREGWRGIRSTPHSERWIPVGLFTFVLVSIVVFGLVNYPPINVYFWLSAGALAGLGRLGAGQPDQLGRIRLIAWDDIPFGRVLRVARRLRRTAD